tara:strand:- start:571 stop:1167 length:597 start_codon:yes stop_codon:yes gene_type:complete
LEEKKMEINNFIKIYDDILPLEVVSDIIVWSNKTSFQDAGIVGGENESVVHKKTRKAKSLALDSQQKSLTNVHFARILGNIFSEYIQKYFKDLEIPGQIQGIKAITDILILKYEEGGHYIWHTDHAGGKIPRTLSCILFLNNDYEGGNLMFRDPNLKNEMSIDILPGRLIVWPSNFMYPHTVKPVTKGTRYSIVAWAD